MSDDDRENSGSNSRKLTLLLSMDNYMNFKMVIRAYVVNYGVYAVSSNTDYQDYPPPPYPGPNTPLDILHNYRENDRVFQRHKRGCAHICSLLYNSLSVNVRIRFDANQDASQAISYGANLG
jgi:hypothetical protein